jgi:hypothetical protein
MDILSQSASDSLVPVASLQEFFRDSLDAALVANHVFVDHGTAHYVVQLLTLFARSDACYDPADNGALHRPLALMFAAAAEAGTRDERLFALQRIGDVALFTAGFFAEALHERVVGLDYYVNMGGGAYRTLAASGRGTTRGAALGEVFAELAAKFPDIVDALNEVRELARGASDHDILRLYDTWLRTGSRRAGRLLRQMGVQPVHQSLTDYEH